MSLVAVFFNSTLAPTMAAPLGSVTSPVIDEVNVCAKASWNPRNNSVPHVVPAETATSKSRISTQDLL
jgi:hypothetical protein